MTDLIFHLSTLRKVSSTSTISLGKVAVLSFQFICTVMLLLTNSLSIQTRHLGKGASLRLLLLLLLNLLLFNLRFSHFRGHFGL